jgi:hypothetical protein
MNDSNHFPSLFNYFQDDCNNHHTHILTNNNHNDNLSNILEQKNTSSSLIGKVGEMGVLNRTNKNDQNDQENITDDEIIQNTYNPAEITISQMPENFSSRDLIKLFIFLTNKKNNINIKNKNEFSLKGIKFWEILSKDERYRKVFKKYRAWTLHTTFKRVFSIATVEEISKLIIHNPKLDLAGLKKILKNKKRKRVKRINEPLSSSSQSIIDDKQISQRDKDRMSQSEINISENNYDKERLNDENNITSKNDNTMLINLVDSCTFYPGHIEDTENIHQSDIKPINTATPTHTFNSYNNKITILPDEFNYLIVNTNQYKNNIRDKLSDVYDIRNNVASNSITQVPFTEYKNLCYVSFINSQKKRFYHSLALHKDSFINHIRFYHKKYNYDESFIIESMMKTSNNLSDLDLFLSDPINNSHILWTELEDKIILTTTTDHDNLIYKKIQQTKGNNKILERIEYLKQYINI